ncbi:MAG: hypothetical protein HY796_13660, partial [Elusimicrobia bacterium]|nr:hypothetical protein [Elusimicrobiota bacterium]
ECCSGGGVFSKQACTAGAIGITGPSDLILYKPAANSKFITLRATAGCCPAKFKWSSSSSDKIKFLGATDQAAVVVKPLAASATKDDISVFVAIDGVTSPPKKLTVRRPNKMTRPDKLECIVRKETFRATYVVGTPDQFKWTLTDQLGDPMVGIKVTEIVTFDSTYGNITLAETRFPKSGQKEPITETTDKAGQMEDQYIIPIGDRKAHVSVHVIQVLKLIEEGYEGTAQIYLSETDVTGTNPVKFK